MFNSFSNTETAFRVDSLPVLIGAGVLMLWLVGERLLQVFGLHQPRSPGRELLSFYWQMLSFYGAVFFSFFDATVLHWTTISAGASGLCYVGVPFVLAGFAVRIVSRLTLGKHFSGHVQTTEEHRLVTTGIYGVIRHPLYLGYLSLLVGFPICFGSMGGLACAMLSGVPGLLYRVRVEETALARWFGEDYRRYQATTPGLIPRRHAYGGLVVLVSIVAGAILWGPHGRPAGVSVSVHSYQRQGEGLSASLVLTNTGTVSLAVPLRFECRVHRLGGYTNYVLDTPNTVFLLPSQRVILSNALWLVRLPADTSAWTVNLRFRQMSGRERLVDALHRSGLVNHRTLSRLYGRPRTEASYQWRTCDSGSLEVPRHSGNSE